MDLPSVSQGIKAGDLPIDRLAGNSQLSEVEKIAGASRHFEALLLRQFLNEAHKPLLGPKSSSGAAINSIYQDMMVHHLADEISRTGHFGLARFFQSQMVPPQQGAADTEGSRTADQ